MNLALPNMGTACCIGGIGDFRDQGDKNTNKFNSRKLGI